MKKIVLLSILFLICKYSQAQTTPYWYQLGQATDSIATTVDAHDSIIYVSGTFDTAFGFAANHFGMYINGHGVNPGTGFIGGYASSFFNFGNTEYAGGNFNGYFRQFNFSTKTWDSIIPINSSVISLDTFQNQIVVATDSAVMLYDTGTHQLTTIPKNFNGLLTSVAVFQNKIWMVAYNNNGDTLSNLYTWDGTTIGDSAIANIGIVYIYSDGNYLFISGREVGGANDNDVAIYSGGSFSEISNDWSYALVSVGYITTISGNPSTGYFMGGDFIPVDGDGKYHPCTFFAGGTLNLLSPNITGVAYGSCYTPDGDLIVVGNFSLTGGLSSTVVTLGTTSGISKINDAKPFLYPNPFHDKFMIENVNTNTTYQLCDELGRVLTVLKPTGNTIVFQDDQLTDGLYFLTETNHPENTIKLIKQ